MPSILPKDSEYNQSRNLVVSASAGSGKTTALTQRLVQLLLSNRIPHNDLRNILAITFTNNAALEMKQRALQLLQKAALGDEDTMKKLGPLLSLNDAELRFRAEAMVEEILDRYSDFQVQTIDSFLVRVFKASALEFGFPPDFEIVVDGGRLLDEAFDLFARDVWNGSERARLVWELVHLLVNIHGDGKFIWNPYDRLADEVKNLYGRILNTSHPLANDGDGDLSALAKKLVESIKRLDQAIASAGLERSSRFNDYMEKLTENRIDHLLNVPTQITKQGRTKKEAYRRAQAGLEPFIREVTSLQNKLALLRARLYFEPYIRAHLLFQETLDLVKRQQGKLDLADAAYKLAQEINAGIVPEIYFNLGETIYHYLIDEFQDTGPVQWSNLRPLIENALSAGGSLFVVGDTKQSIYGFRGGDWRIMKQMMDEDVFPSAPREVKTLPCNWRSGERILEFTRKVFHEVVPARISNGAEDASGLKSFEQEPAKALKGKGYVVCRFIEGDTETRPERDQIISTIRDCLTRGYRQRDITILTPENEDVVRVSGWLNEEGMDFIPFSTLDIRTRKVIGELLALLRFLDSPVDDLAFATFLFGETFSRRLRADEYTIGVDDFHRLQFQRAHSGRRDSLYVAFRSQYEELWKRYFDELFGLAGYLPLYDLTSHIVKHFGLLAIVPEEEAALVKLLEVIKNFEERGENSLREFARYAGGDDEDADWTMAVPPNVDAVTIMTVHKAKGLGFRVVLVLLYDKRLKYDNVVLAEGDEGVRLMRVTKDEATKHESLLPFWREKELAARVDQLNKLYVALTRAEEELYVFSVKYEGRNEPSAFLPEEGFAETEKPTPRLIPMAQEVQASLYHHTVRWHERVEAPWGIRWNETRRGDLIHRILARITFIGDDLTSVLDDAIAQERSVGNDEVDAVAMQETLLPFLRHESLRPYFSRTDGRIVLNEQEFTHSTGRLLRMDRVVVDPDSVTVLDYKTGSEQPDHIEQVREYMEVLRDIYPDRSVNGLLAYVDLNIIRTVQ